MVVIVDGVARTPLLDEDRDDDREAPQEKENFVFHSKVKLNFFVCISV